MNLDPMRSPREKRVAVTDRSRPGLGYSLTALFISCAVAGYQYIKWLSIVGHDTNWPFVFRGASAVSLGIWAGKSAAPRRTRVLQFAAFGVPQLLLINSWSVLPLIATPHEPAVLPFFLAFSAMSLGDLVLWCAGLALSARLFRGRTVEPSRQNPDPQSTSPR